MKYSYLSYPLNVADPHPPAIPAAELYDYMTVDKDGASVQIIKTANHTGTHLDTSAHVFNDGIPITDFLPQDLIFTEVALVDLRLSDEETVMPEQLEPYREQLQNFEMAIFRFGVAEIRKKEPERFSNRLPGFGMESAQWLRDNLSNLRCIGTDLPSIATIAQLDITMRAHNILLAGREKRLIIEEMNVAGDLSGLSEVRINPWMVKGMLSGPCSIIGIIK
ncbi:MAG: cyclase family protein [Clostridia bacterium]|nr:cyclase family protein [Clostridia bacterium]